MEKKDKKKISLSEFREKALLKTEDMSTLMLIDPPSIWLSYLIYLSGLKITPNDISYTRLFLLAPLAILFLFLAPLLEMKIFYLLFSITIYLMLLSDGMDGHLARGSDQKSDFGAFLDMISDRVLIVIFIVMVFSMGMFLNDPLLIYGSVIVFVSKLYNMTIISKIFYHGKAKMDKDEIFSAKKQVKNLGITGFNSLTLKLNKTLGIKRWCGYIGAFDRMFITIVLPGLLLFFNLNRVASWMAYILIIMFTYFYLSRTTSLISEYRAQIYSYSR